MYRRRTFAILDVFHTLFVTNFRLFSYLKIFMGDNIILLLFYKYTYRFPVVFTLKVLLIDVVFKKVIEQYLRRFESIFGIFD